jgi:hypothetical protein
VLKKDGEDQFDHSCMKHRSTTHSHGEQENHAHNKQKEGQLDFTHLVQELPSKTHYSRKDRKKHRSEGTMKKMM